MKRFLAGLVLALGLLAWPAMAAPVFPALTGRVVDQANMLSPAVEADLTRKLADLETQSGRQLVVATLPSLQGYEIEEYGYQLGRAWGIGSAESDDGALFIVAPAERKVRIEVGYGLEPVLTDALSSVILQSQVLPRFRDGDMEGGVAAGAEAIIAQLNLPPDEARAIAARATEERQAEGEGGPGIIPVIIFIVIVLLIMRGGGGGGRRGRNTMLPWIILGGLEGMRGGRGGGSSWGGGGFSGGGGSFGGGGASGRW